MNAADYAIAYRKRGWYPIPIPPRSKIPPVEKWQTLRIEIDQISKYFTGEMNIGILTGVSRGLTDIDLDTPQAIRLAPLFLSDTLVFGRKSAPWSHWLYTAYGARTEVFTTPQKINGEKQDTVTLLELRANGRQTIFPGSTHDITGEKIEWCNTKENPTEVKAEVLRKSVARLATACLLTQFGFADEAAVAWVDEPVLSVDLPKEVLELAIRWLGIQTAPAPAPKPTKTSPLDDSFEIAVVRWNAANPVILPKNSGPCPVCKDTKSFGRLPDNNQKWSCFSTDHPNDVGRRSPKDDCYWGDALDLAAFTRNKTRAQVLREDGFLTPRPPNPESPPPPPGGGNGPTAPPEDFEKVIVQMTTELYDVIDQTIDGLRPARELYQRGMQLVRVASSLRAPMQLQIFGSTPTIEPISAPTLTEVITRYIQVQRYKEKDDEWVNTLPPAALVNPLLDRGVWRGVRPLEGLVEVPTIRIDGTILETPGYDEPTGLIYMPSITFDPVKENPTLGDAQAAIEELLDLVCEFPFAVDEKLPRLYQSAWLAAMLTPFVRSSLPTAPMFTVNSNVRGSGKSKLCDIVALTSTGRPMPRTANPPHDEEFKKMVTSLAMGGAGLVMIDNVAGELGSPALDSVLTGPTWKDRILGKSEMTAEIPMTTTWFATGNNIMLVGDLSRRVINIALRSEEENPETRQEFKYANILEYVRENRARLVSRVLTILRAYVVAGSPVQKMRAMDFQEWSATVRGALVWAGLPDPGETQVGLSAGDTDKNGLAMMIAALEDLGAVGQSGRSVAALLNIVASHSKESLSLSEALAELCPTRDGRPPSTVSVGKRLGVLRGRVVGGKYLDRVGDFKRGAFWAVQLVSEKQDSQQ